MLQSKPIMLLAVFTAILASSCQFFGEKAGEKLKRVIRVEKPVTRVDVTIDTANAYNGMFLDSSVVNNFIMNSGFGDTLSNRIRSFYNSRNNQYAWFSKGGLPEHTVSFWNMLTNYLNYSKDSSVYDKKLAKKMDAIIQADSLVVKNDSSFQQLDMELTKYYYLYSDHAYADDPDFDIKSLEYSIPKKKYTAEALTDSILEKKDQFSDEYAPRNTQYVKLREKLQEYKAIKDAGGWPEVNTKVEIMKKGYKGAAVLELKKRLKTEGFLSGEDSTFTDVYDSSLADAVNAAKRVYGYKPDGTAGKTFVKDLNATIEERIQQILINIKRMRWIPVETKDSGRAIMVNIPEYKLYVYEGGKPAWNMDVVVGKVGNHTTTFTGRLNQVVFSPYWNVPTSIAKKEIIPKGGGYMARNHYEYHDNGRVRQKPGPWNSLGLVKFLFPNSYDIYFHDSPAKALFNRDKRSFSHGCIRLKEPARFAEYILDDTAKWNAQTIDSAMNSGKEKYVRVKHPLPVLITYFTSWVGDDGNINFREDIYGYDEEMAKKQFLNGLETTKTGERAKKDSLAKKDSIEKAKKQATAKRIE